MSIYNPNIHSGYELAGERNNSGRNLRGIKMNNKECEDIKRIAKELWHLYNEVKINNLDKLRAKIQELNAYMSSYGGYNE